MGVWRILREFEKRQLPLTVFGVGMALQRHPEDLRRATKVLTCALRDLLS